jgi:hypothetical protein
MQEISPISRVIFVVNFLPPGDQKKVGESNKGIFENFL